MLYTIDKSLLYKFDEQEKHYKQPNILFIYLRGVLVV